MRELPDAYLPLFGNDFLAACEGHPADVGMAYLRAIWHYWHHLHCEGLEDRDALLRSVCRVDDERWPEVRAVIFDSGRMFRLVGGAWHQDRALQEWGRCLKLMRERSESGKRAARARWGARL